MDYHLVLLKQNSWFESRQERRTMTKEELKRLKKETKTKIVEVTAIRMKKRHKFEYKRSPKGAYCFKDKKIYILKRMSNEKKYAVILHELAHALCHEAKCRCLKQDNYKMAEIHAMAYSLDRMYKEKRWKILEWMTICILGWASEKDNGDGFCAARLIKNTKILSFYMRACKKFA